jgi:hypothetical protein
MADVELPPIVVSATPVPIPRQPPDIVSKDRDQRSPDVHWSKDLSPERAEMFAHNEIEINASCATVWNHLIQAQLWPQWFPKCGKVQIKDRSKVLQKNTNLLGVVLTCRCRTGGNLSPRHRMPRWLNSLRPVTSAGSVTRQALFMGLFATPIRIGFLLQFELIGATSF